MSDSNNDQPGQDRAETVSNGKPQAAAQTDVPAIPDDEAKRVFLRALSITGDILAAAQAANYADDVAFFDLRLANIGFAAEWDAAMHAAYLRLESALVAGALQVATKPPENADLRGMAAWHRLSLNLLAAHRAARGHPKKSSQNTGLNTKEDLLSKLNLMRMRTEERRANMVHNE